jgi:Ca2+-binding RTX toxin-like protein
LRAYYPKLFNNLIEIHNAIFNPIIYVARRLGDDFYDGKQGEVDAGDDTIHGEEGNDTIRDSRGIDILYGEKGRDVLNAVDHVDHIGADTLIGGTGKDIL